MSIHNLCTKADEIKDFSNIFCPVTTPVLIYFKLRCQVMIYVLKLINQRLFKCILSSNNSSPNLFQAWLQKVRSKHHNALFCNDLKIFHFCSIVIVYTTDILEDLSLFSIKYWTNYIISTLRTNVSLQTFCV